MGAKISNIINYSPTSSDIFLFDNSVWMYLFCPLGNYNVKQQKAYSSFLQSCQSSRSTIFINSLILSEFCNRYFRLDFELWKKDTSNFSAEFKKDFVGIKRYKETAELIENSIKKIMKFCERATDNFNAIELNNIFILFKEIDFNDSYYLELARINKWKIVTDDKDFTKSNSHNIHIITSL